MSRPTETEALTALHVLAAFLVPAPGAPVEAPRYADLHAHGPGVYRRALAAIKDGELRAYEPARGKRLVLTEDFQHWLESDRHRVQPAAEIEPEPMDDIGDVIAINAQRRKRKGRAA